MNEKQIIETLINIKKYCESRTGHQCKFYNKDTASCLFEELADNLGKEPHNWDIREIEELINE